ncbi:STAS domain-containing protein [Geodermatophilus sp. SYSU D01105]
MDLSRTESMDSSGLGALIAGLKTARQAGGDLRIAAAGEQVEAVLELTNLRKVLRPRPDVASAFAGD